MKRRTSSTPINRADAKAQRRARRHKSRKARARRARLRAVIEARTFTDDWGAAA